jgi:predicted phosphoadenosine phosphosulfate sulfurtransferase
MPKRYLGMDVLTAARQRIARVFDDFPRVVVSFSGGKDSTALLHLVAEEARSRGRRFGLLLVDLEAQYKLTIEHAEAMYAEYADVADPYWVALPLSLRNAVSMIQPKWMCWEPGLQDIWVRKPPKFAITDPGHFEFFRVGMEFEEFIEQFAWWYAGGQLCASLVGIRTAESLNRWRAVSADNARYQGLKWTTYKDQTSYNAYPIYDWRTEDIWTYFARTGLPYNELYDRMHFAGLSIHQMRICQPYGDDQRKGLWLYQIIEPETWGRVVARVAGANSGALYAQESGNILGRIKISKPDHLTWREFAELLLETMPPQTAEHYRNKIAQFIHWYGSKSYGIGIPDEADPELERQKKAPSWRRVCKMLLRNDYWAKSLSFSQTKSEAYEKYVKVMQNRRKQWGIFT